MSTDDLKQKAASLKFTTGTPYSWIQELVCEGFLDTPVSSADVVHRVAERFTRRWDTSRVQVYMRKFVGIIHAVKPRGSRANYWVLATVTRAQALSLIGVSKKVVEVEECLFSKDLEARLQKNFSAELEELRSVFGRHGNSSAFLLRKILEKLLVIVFRKSGKSALIEDRRRPGGLIGLEAMIGLAVRERVDSSPLLSGKTGTAIQGIKFLGDTAAHNPLVNVDVEEILPQMPYVIVAYKELAARL